MLGMPGMSRMSVGLARGILGVLLMGGYMAGLEVNRWEIVGGGHKTKQETMGMFPMPMYTTKDGGLLLPLVEISQNVTSPFMTTCDL